MSRGAAVCQIQLRGVDYLMIALLEGKESVTVSEALELRHIQYLDIGKLNLVARIDLTEWKTQPDSRRYITFSKGRVGRKLGDFFMDLLGAREGWMPRSRIRGCCRRWTIIATAAS